MPDIEAADGAGPAETPTPAPTPAIDAAFAGDANAPGSELEVDWTKGVLIIAAGSIPSLKSGDKRAVMICEAWSDPVLAEDGDTIEPATRRESGYPAKGHLYFRTDPSTDFGDHGPVFTLGIDVRQVGFWGLADRAGFVCVGPAMPAYACLNIAVQNGATEIEIYGLTDRQKGLLQPFIDDLKSDPDVQTPVEGGGRGHSRPDVQVTLK